MSSWFLSHFAVAAPGHSRASISGPSNRLTPPEWRDCHAHSCIGAADAQVWNWHFCPVDADVWARQLLGVDLPPKCPPAQILKVAES